MYLGQLGMSCSISECIQIVARDFTGFSTALPTAASSHLLMPFVTNAGCWTLFVKQTYLLPEHLVHGR